MNKLYIVRGLPGSGKNIHIGCFSNEKDASNAYKVATEALHKDFANEQV